MKKVSLILVLVSLLSSNVLAQQLKISESELKEKLDSILHEGNLLYKYEKAAWISNELAFKNPTVKAEFHGYLTYEEQSEIKSIILAENLQTCIAEYTFEDNFDQPKYVKIEKREVSDKEKTLIEVRQKILENILDDGKYEVSVPKGGYNLNFILLPFADKYKLYMITGTTEPNVVPFGNDYIFIADENGEIESWHKFHSQLIPSPTITGGNNSRKNNAKSNKVTGLIHTHLPSTPLMTATDICTFLLYAPIYDLKTLTVLHGRVRVAMKYWLKENKITTEYF